MYGEQLDPTLDPEKLKKAIEKEKKFRANSQKHEEEADDKKRKYNSMESYEVTAEEMEAYRMNKPNSADPMLNFQDDDLLDYEGEEERPSKKSKKKKKH